MAGGYLRISNDSFQLEAGIGRQREDITTLGQRVNVKKIVWYVENDTSAFKKKPVRMPDGSVEYRVVRPKFTRMLQDLEAGKIKALLFYDLDRLARQPRDLEDLIDIVERNGAPVYGVTGTMDLRTSDGRTMARFMVAVANKSSADTARRVIRAKLADARSGKVLARRRFGRNPDGSIIEQEAAVLRWALGRIVAGKSWAETIRIIEAGPVRPIGGGRWHLNTLRNMLMSPQIAGIAVYRGALRTQGAKGVDAADPARDALKDADGDYVLTSLDPIVTPQEREAFAATIRARHEGTDPAPSTAAKYLLSGLCRCGKIKADGTVCNHRLVGKTIKRGTGDKARTVVVYGCPGKAHGGCAGVQRDAAPLEELITELFRAYLAEQADKHEAEPAPVVELSKAEADLAEARTRLAALQVSYASGDEGVTQEVFFATLPLLEKRISKLKSAVDKEAAERAGYAPIGRADSVLARFEQADTAGKREILGTYLHAITVRPSTRLGRAAAKDFDHTTVAPIWRQQRATPTELEAAA